MPVLFIVALIALFSETMRAIPVGAFSDNFSNITYEVPRLNSELLENKFINNNKIEYKTTKEEIIIKTKFPNEAEAIKKEEEIIIAKIINSNHFFYVIALGTFFVLRLFFLIILYLI